MTGKTEKKDTKKKMVAHASCYFTQLGSEPDYKEILVLRRFISDRGKILPQKYSGLCAKHQRAVANAIKRSRYMGLLPYTDKHAI